MKIGPLSLCRTQSLNSLERRLDEQANRIAELEQGLKDAHLRAVRLSGDSDDVSRLLPPARPSRKPRSVLFLHNGYYHHFYMAKALRQRGWDAISASLEPEDGPNSLYSHGQDICLYDPDPEIFAQKVMDLFVEAQTRFDLVYLHGTAQLSFFPDLWDRSPEFTEMPWDLLELRRRGVLLGFSVSGCLDGISQSAFSAWSGGACEKCIWQTNPVVCSDRRNLALGHKLSATFDLVEVSTDPPLDWFGAANVHNEPLTFALDPDVWNPNLKIPLKHRIERPEDEVLVFHAVGNYQQRTDASGRNLKGTHRVFEAVEQLRAEGENVRLIFAEGIPNTEMRFMQAQADIVVDQLNYGRVGATARESMMLGKPTVARFLSGNIDGAIDPDWVTESPVVRADEETITDVLRDLVRNPDQRITIGRRSREYALKWHSADSCAARFESAIESLAVEIG